MKKTIIVLTFSLFLVLGTVTVLAKGYEWRDHAPPFDLEFGNHIDTHQQSQKVDGNKLEGFFYIKFTGEVTEDGYPVAMHADCNMVEPPEACTVGWVLHGIAVNVKGKLVKHDPGQHPTWCLDRKDVPRQPGYSHFHWLSGPEHAHGLEVGDTYDGYVLKLTAVDRFFFRHHGGFLVEPGIDDKTHANIVTDCE